MTIRYSGFAIAAGVAFWLCSSSLMVRAAELGKPTGDLILSVSGAIANTNSDGKAEFDLDMLKALPTTSFKTSTTWTSGVSNFTGVSMQALLAAVGGNGTQIEAIALNDYAVDIPVADAVADGPIIAYMMDDKPMSIRDKGPLWIIYPFDAKAEYRTEATYSKSIWQLSRLVVK